MHIIYFLKINIEILLIIKKIILLKFNSLLIVLNKKFNTNLLYTKRYQN